MDCAFSRARLAALSQDCRTSCTHSTLLSSRTFGAPPFSGLALLVVLKCCSGARSKPSFPRSDNIRWMCGFSPFPSWMASVKGSWCLAVISLAKAVASSFCCSKFNSLGSAASISL